MSTKKEINNPGDLKKSALLVIDVQQGLLNKSTPIYQADALIKNILKLITKAHAAQAPVVYIQHCNQRDLIKGTDGWQLYPGLNPLPDDPRIFKEHGNAFEETNLGKMLQSRGIGTVIACGLVTHGCVKSTCLGGLAEGYQVILAGDAHSSFSGDAALLIDKWNQALAEEGVAVKPAAEINF